jgi:hypothetical protein
MANTLLGYRIRTSDGMYVHRDADGHHYLSDLESEPLPRADAYRRLAGFFEQDDCDLDDFEVIPVHRELTPLEKTSSSLACQLQGLCSAHGLDLGITREQMEAKLAQELTDFGALASKFIR